MDIIKIWMLTLTFFAELTALLSFGLWGFQIPKGLLLKCLLGIGLPLVVAISWGLFLAPKAVYPTGLMIRIPVKIIIFSLSAIAFYAIGQRFFALSFFIVTLMLVTLTENWNLSTKM
ncbi:YrdB family protein [Sporolactobacillus kofuensis]|uniref:YrdB family protein n=1 Tax=Sporolactobacillus kofuensis TaxID=269672 RepID=A0ABW1WEB1_9BACL|nr:YrdB family protein [Sporolactobacillus kofuensis]MCO7176682.1 YrdB family protein [Sporolactobacillus kofuensis]